MLRSLARAAALRAARALLLPELREALDGIEAHTWQDTLDVIGMLVGLERRFLALGAERDGLANRLACAVEMAAQAEHERDALREALGRLAAVRDELTEELAEHLEALEEVRGKLAAEQRQTVRLAAQVAAQQAIAETMQLVAAKMERRAMAAEERLRAAQLAAEGGR